ncbi:hypothetical protein UAW_00040 [Enterococcus haemoperoxidus ATCC BAA-382]|uniref:Histidine kinase n=1 Tax=Enterococcus haemoperoxidus ATCC BAA-382 TaxID=1158608 RepID=R2T002_9ENTE|nr:histidine kinase [Enterococcus haemoperoxidus]EOI00773.1 hypothetical protein UAW_00040 [Enterococcus haemoperoxidus ATCC BAA-382]EOT62007.1 hypothetical protein I583_01007 [Enterococcus haemoperoxidus ATCC BAA-382]OJG52099.1 hypothetical protein RV06_GL001114 [Enterococcus haemoperoxidus]
MENVYLTIYTSSELSQQTIEQSQELLKRFPIKVRPHFQLLTKVSSTNDKANQSFCKRAMDCSSCPSSSGIFRKKRSSSYCHRCSYGLSKFIYPFQYCGNERGLLIFGPFFKDETDINLLILSDIDIAGANERMNILNLFEVEDLEKVENFASVFAAFLSQTLTMEKLEKEKQKTENNLKILSQKIEHIENQDNIKGLTPYFVFNSLTTLARLAHFNENPDLEEAVYKLSSVIRYNYQSQNHCVSLEEAFSYLNDYLELSTTRSIKRLSYQVNLPQELTQYRIPVMTLIPIVENLLEIRLPKYGDDFSLLFTVTKTNGNIIITIQEQIHLDRKRELVVEEEFLHTVANRNKKLIELLGDQAHVQVVEMSNKLIVEVVIPASKGLIV